jgi:peptide/nickel transport system substrate-binding protein
MNTTLTKRIFPLLLGTTALSLSLAGCHSSGPSGSGGSGGGGGSDTKIKYATDHTVDPPLTPGKYGGSLVYAQPGDPKTFNAITADDASSGNVLAPLYDSLERRNSFTLKYEPRLADLPKISPDGLTYTYTLKPNLKWSDGQPLTADDFIFTLDVIFDPTTQTTARDGMLIDVAQPDGSMKRVPFQYKKIDDRTLQFTLPTKWAPAETIFSISPLPKHILEASYKAGKFNSTYGIDTPPSQLVSCGPYIMSEFVPSQRIVYKPNPYFWRKTDGGQQLPYIASYNYTIVPDFNATQLTFQGGQSDVLDVAANMFPTIKKGEAKGDYTVVSLGPSWGFNYLCLNMNPSSKNDKDLTALFRDVRFRHAISYAINRERIATEVFQGLAHPLYTPITPANMPYFNPNVVRYDYDLNKAKQMLTSIGLTKLPDGMYAFPGTQKEIKFNIITNTENQQRKEAASIIQEDLKNIGLNVTFTPINFNDMVRRIDAEPYDWQATIGGFVGGPEPNNVSSIWRSSGQLHMWWPKQKQPATPWEAQIDKDFAMGAHELDPVKRKKYYDDWQQIVAVQQPVIFTVYSDQYAAMRDRFGNVQPSSLYGLGGSVLWNMEELYDTHAAGTSPAQQTP